jgi:hypothetical protein
VTRIDVLPDDVLLEVFDFYIKDEWSEAWQLLVHVCRRWRSLVFQSPRRLNLRLYYKTTKDTQLDVWPALPLFFRQAIDSDFIITLKHSNRLGRVSPWARENERLNWEKVFAAMQVPFPELTDLRLFSAPRQTSPDPVIPDSFLGGSAPCLQHFELKGIPFPGLPKLLLSATHLVHLRLLNIPRFGFIPPEAMVALLSVLSNLDTLESDFNFQQSFRDLEIRSLPPPNRSILPALDKFNFKGIPEYLEDLVTYIDAPQLKYFNIKFFLLGAE